MKPVTMEFLWETIDEGKRQLAAKDREIAALNVTVRELAEQFDTLRTARDREIAELSAKYEAVVFKYDAAVEKSITLMQERDEARECVGRVWPFVREYESMLHDGHETAESLARLRQVRAALAATPEHLRNA
jgi:chromosome segregation ATPase